MEFDFDDVARKLKEAGMDEQAVKQSVDSLKKAVSTIPEEELEGRIDELGGTDGIASAILKEYKEHTSKENEPEETPAEESAEAQTEEKPEEIVTDTEEEPAEQTEKTDEQPGEEELLNIINIDDDMFSDETGEETEENGEDRADKVISDIENGVEPAPSVVVNNFFDDDDEDIKVKKSDKNKKNGKKQQSDAIKPVRVNKPAQPQKKVSVKNMSQRAKAAYIIGLILLIPLLIAIVIAITIILLALYIAIIALVIVFSVALVLIAAAGTALSLMAIIFGVIQITQGQAIPGIYEIGLGIVAGGITLGVSILLYNFIVRLAPFLFKKMFVLYKFLFRQLTKLMSFVKGVCSKL